MRSFWPWLPLRLVLAYEPCKNPLFAVHWAPKIDIQTLNEFPWVKTDLRLCHAYNHKSSCCHETFESEQQNLFREKLLRMDEHRQAVEAVSKYMSTPVDIAQLEAVMSQYETVLGPKTASVRSQCFHALLTYVAGMICFSCNITWFRYLKLADDSNDVLKEVLRVRVAPEACMDLWAACRPFSDAVMALKDAIRDSVVARNASASEEASASCVTRYQLNLLADGKVTGFDLHWRDPFASGVARRSIAMGVVLMGILT
eukprot:g6405.t1